MHTSYLQKCINSSSYLCPTLFFVLESSDILITGKHSVQVLGHTIAVQPCWKSKNLPMSHTKLQGSITSYPLPAIGNIVAPSWRPMAEHLWFLVCLHLVAQHNLPNGAQQRSDDDDQQTSGKDVCSGSALSQLPPAISMAAAREEAELVIFESVEKALEKANIRPNQVHYTYSIEYCVIKTFRVIYKHTFQLYLMKSLKISSAARSKRRSPNLLLSSKHKKGDLQKL